jgi:hypothetical protein
MGADCPRTEPEAAGGSMVLGEVAHPRTEPGGAAVEEAGHVGAAGGGPENVAGPTMTELGWVTIWCYSSINSKVRVPSYVT